MKVTILCLCMMLLFSLECRAGLDTLIEAARSQDEIQRQYEKETRAFERVKSAIESGAIKKGQTSSDIEAKYGKALVAIKDLDGRRADWIYKPAASSFFKGIRAVLIFTEQGILDEAQVEKNESSD